MRVTVEHITFDEFKEAAAAVRDAQVKKQQQQARRSPATFIWAIGLATVIFLTMLIGIPMPDDPLADRRPPLYLLLTFMLPLACVLVLAMVTVAVQRSASAKGMLARLLLSLIPVVLIVPVLAGLWFLPVVTNGPPAAAAPAPPRDWYGTLLPHAGWVLITTFLIVVTMRATRAQTRQTWEAQPSVARPKVFDITSSGVAIDETVTHRRYTWLALTHFLETPNLLLLCPSDVTFEILPKRSFATADDLHAVRRLFETEVRDRATASAAFPVLPLPPAAPERVR